MASGWLLVEGCIKLHDSERPDDPGSGTIGLGRSVKLPDRSCAIAFAVMSQRLKVDVATFPRAHPHVVSRARKIWMEWMEGEMTAHDKISQN